MRILIAQIVAVIILVGISVALYQLGMYYGLPFSFGFILAGVLFQIAYKCEHGKWFGD